MSTSRMYVHEGWVDFWTCVLVGQPAMIERRQCLCMAMFEMAIIAS